MWGVRRTRSGACSCGQRCHLLRSKAAEAERCPTNRATGLRPNFRNLARSLALIEHQPGPSPGPQRNRGISISSVKRVECCIVDGHLALQPCSKGNSTGGYNDRDGPTIARGDERPVPGGKCNEVLMLLVRVPSHGFSDKSSRPRSPLASAPAHGQSSDILESGRNT
jgi:hypothetical protein